MLMCALANPNTTLTYSHDNHLSNHNLALQCLEPDAHGNLSLIDQGLLHGQRSFADLLKMQSA